MFILKFHSSKYLLELICILFLLTRLYKIAEIPSSVYWDEASIGYNAYSIAQTGKDEWGEVFPLHFRAFGEFKLPVFIYSVALFVKTFGLSILSVRLPSVLFSLGVVLVTYLLTKRLTEDSGIAVLSSFFISISPWFFIFSRTGYEATAGLMFYLLAIYLFLLITNKNFLLLSVLSFILSTYSYNSFRIITPFTILTLLFLNINDALSVIKKARVALVISVVLIILSVIPIYRLYVYDAGIFRFQAVSISNPRMFMKNYLSHFNLNFLLNGDKNLRNQQNGFGQIYLPEIVLLFFGLLYLLKKKSKLTILLLTLMLISPIPAAITKESPHALRTITFAPILSIVSALGVFQLRKILKIKFVEFGIAIVMLLFFINYFANFINIYLAQSSKDWQYGYQRIYLDYKEQFTKYKKVVISDEYAQPYIFALFYLKINPDKFRESVVRNDISNWGFSTVRKFNNFEFGKANQLWELAELKNSLIFATPKDKIPNLQPSSAINFLDGSVAFWVYQL